jgi:predicted metal-dependent enzyme (double-stranded beta helix superfamily)
MSTATTEAAVGPTRDTRELLAIARANADALWARARRLQAGEGTRSYARIRSASDYDVWVIVWGPGSGIELHDHGGSGGAYAVARGVLADVTEVADGEHRTQRIVVGDDGRALGPGTRHAVRNPGDDTAVSVHVYSPPLASIRFYDTPDAPREELVHGYVVR